MIRLNASILGLNFLSDLAKGAEAPLAPFPQVAQLTAT